ncbi:hypothetical protein [Leisingera thetidis]|nr:hypothetical protein [Leisingera thetidis]
MNFRNLFLVTVLAGSTAIALASQALEAEGERPGVSAAAAKSF